MKWRRRKVVVDNHSIRHDTTQLEGLKVLSQGNEHTLYTHKRKPKVLEIDPDYGAMKCPHCGDIYTHVDGVTILNAAGDRLHAVAYGEDEQGRIDLTTDRQTETYYGRRHTIIIDIDCENCWTRSSVRLHQHKGNTMAGITYATSPAYEGI